MKTDVIRTSWPRVSAKIANGSKGWKIDARRKGTNGKEEFRKDKAEALSRAAEIAAEFAANGNEGLAISAELRFMAVKGEELLQPFGKSVLQACQFYRDYLAEDAARMAGEIVEKLADEWYAYKKSGKQKKLRPATLESIWTGVLNLKKAFAKLPITSVTEKDVRTYLDNLDVAPITRKNLRNLFGQFFNWCIEHEKGITVNPSSKKIVYTEGAKDVAIWTPAFAEKALRLCESEFPQLTLYHALSLFAGLRPEECQQLTWENIDLTEKTIMVLHETTKVKETRPVPIEENLMIWLELVPGVERKGLVVRKKNFSNIVREMRAKLGYRYLTERNGKALNPNGPLGEYVPDVLRHSYGSHWLGRKKNRAELAENMGNSVDIIKKHYKRNVGNADALTYWSILPESKKDKRKKQMDNLRDGFDSLAKH